MPVKKNIRIQKTEGTLRKAKFWSCLDCRSLNENIFTLKKGEVHKKKLSAYRRKFDPLFIFKNFFFSIKLSNQASNLTNSYYQDAIYEQRRRSQQINCSPFFWTSSIKNNICFRIIDTMSHQIYFHWTLG